MVTDRDEPHSIHQLMTVVTGQVRGHVDTRLERCDRLPDKKIKNLRRAERNKVDERASRTRRVVASES
jgi:hypothetical protein